MSKNTDDITTLDPRLARRVLVMLVEQEAKLKPTIMNIVEEAIQNPDIEEFVSELEEKLTDFDDDHVYGRSGKSFDGYKEPWDAAFEILSEIVNPYLDKMSTMIDSGEDKAALAICQAIVLALYNYNQEACEEFLQDSEEVVPDMAGWTVKLWCAKGDDQIACGAKKGKLRKFPQEFVKRNLAEWDWLIDDEPN